MVYTAKVFASPEERNVVGWVIGKGGHGIKEILEKSGATKIDYIKTHSEWSVTGTPNTVDRAIKMLKISVSDKLMRRTQKPLDYRFKTTDHGQVLKGERKGAEQVSTQEILDFHGGWSQLLPPRPNSPLQNSFNAFTIHQRQLHKQHLEEQAYKKEAKEKAARIISHRNEKFDYGTGTRVYKKSSIEDEVWGSSTKISKKKRDRVRKSRPVNLNLEVLPHRTVDVRKLREHNNAVFAKEKLERDTRRKAWEDRNSKPLPELKEDDRHSSRCKTEIPEKSPSPTLEAMERNGEVGSEFLELGGNKMYDIPYHRSEWEMSYDVGLTIHKWYNQDEISKLTKAQLEITGTPEDIGAFKLYLKTNGWLDFRSLTPEDEEHIDEYFAVLDNPICGKSVCA